MVDIPGIIHNVAKLPDCIVYPPQGIPKISPDHTLPNDLLAFYGICGGISLFTSSPYSLKIVSPEKLLLANPAIFCDVSEKDLQTTRGDISWSWYIIGEGENFQFITIDLSSERNGKCYDSFWDRHAMPGSTPVIAKSFTELLDRLVENHGLHWYWLQSEFKSYGDAYDK